MWIIGVKSTKNKIFFVTKTLQWANKHKTNRLLQGQSFNCVHCAAAPSPTLKSDLWRATWKTQLHWDDNSCTQQISNIVFRWCTKLLFHATNCYLTRQAAACGDPNWDEALCCREQQQTIWLDEWVSSLCGDTAPCNKGHNQVKSKFAVRLAGCLDCGEETRAPGLIHLSVDRSSKKKKKKTSEGKMVDELTGKEAWGPSLAANLAKQQQHRSETHLCVHVATLTVSLTPHQQHCLRFTCSWK